MKTQLTFIIHCFLLLTFSSFNYALTGQININTASQKQLKLLPFIGKKRAQAIIQYRQKQGKFTSVNQVLALPEIGQSTYEAMASYIKITGLNTLDDNPSKHQNSPQQNDIIHLGENDLIILTDQNYFPLLLQHINQAKQHIHIGMYVFKISKSAKNRATIIANALVKAQKRGVSVHVLLERNSKAKSLNKNNQITAKYLTKNGVTVIFDSNSITSHEKIIIIDQRWNFIGSHNFTHSAFTYNHEYSLLINSPALAKQNIQYLAQISQDK